MSQTHQAHHLWAGHPHAGHHVHPHTPFILTPLHPTLAEVEEWSHARKWHFWVAMLSCIAFLVGNMIGQHGVRAFWAAVIGAMDPVAMEFDGVVPPLEHIVDPHTGRTYAELTYDQVPSDILIPFPAVADIPACSTETEEGVLGCRIVSTRHLGNYVDGPGSHPGDDFLAPVGTPVVSMMNGIVDRTVERTWGFGNTIVVRHPNAPDPEREGLRTTLFSIYAHLSAIEVQPGDVVRRGQRIGLSGQTGIASAPHLHAQIDRDEAPFHPFFPFTGEQARVAGYSFFEAVNVGLGRVHAQRYTVDPLAYLERFHVGAASTAVAAVDVPRKTVQELRAERIALRKAQRLARVEQRRAERMARSEAGTPPGVTESATVVGAPLPIPLSPDRIEFSHDGGFLAGNWEALRLRLARREGGEAAGTFEGNVHLRVIFGAAELEQQTLTAADFVQGEAVVRILPQGEKTIVISVEGALTGQALPLRYEGARVVSR